MDYRRLVNLGRKAGLTTSELYGALSGRKPEVGDDHPERSDGNGFFQGYTVNGQRTYRPQSEIERSGP